MLKFIFNALTYIILKSWTSIIRKIIFYAFIRRDCSRVGCLQFYTMITTIATRTFLAI